MCVLSALDCCLLFCFNYYYCLLTVTLGSGGQEISATPGEQLGTEKSPFPPHFLGAPMLFPLPYEDAAGRGPQARGKAAAPRPQEEEEEEERMKADRWNFLKPSSLSWLPPVTSMGTFRPPPPLPRFVCLFVLLKLFCAFNKTVLKINKLIII